MTERITPTSHAQQRGRPVRQLGSTAEVIRRLPDGAFLIIYGNAASRFLACDEMERQGRDKTAITIIYSSSGPNALYEIPKEAVVGVTPDAFAGVPRAMWVDMQKILSTRFKEVHWG